MELTPGQWVLTRQAKIPDDFSRMKLLSQYVVAENEVVQLFILRVDNYFKAFIVWDLNGVIVRIGQLSLIVSQHSNFVVAWEYKQQNLNDMKKLFNAVVGAEYGYGSPLLHYWTLVGDDMLAGYQPISIEQWEQKQLKEALQKFDSSYTELHPGEEASYGMISWLMEEEPDVDELDETYGAFLDYIEDELDMDEGDK